jgi:hypothetical protein
MTIRMLRAYRGKLGIYVHPSTHAVYFHAWFDYRYVPFPVWFEDPSAVSTSCVSVRQLHEMGSSFSVIVRPFSHATIPSFTAGPPFFSISYRYAHKRRISLDPEDCLFDSPRRIRGESSPFVPGTMFQNVGKVLLTVEI